MSRQIPLLACLLCFVFVACSNDEGTAVPTGSIPDLSGNWSFAPAGSAPPAVRNCTEGLRPPVESTLTFDSDFTIPIDQDASFFSGQTEMDQHDGLKISISGTTTDGAVSGAMQNVEDSTGRQSTVSYSGTVAGSRMELQTTRLTVSGIPGQCEMIGGYTATR